MRTISISVRGFLDDALRVIAEKTGDSGASWYQVQLVSETGRVTGMPQQFCMGHPWPRVINSIKA
ncbi:hypothetical protein LU604_22280 [Erwinia tracheiphila]|uniref:DUF1471 domain-containing protein n=1 Tax=Erwinia tracheiphila TaxID=65700 RepID=A0A345CXP2_9GAMM|nr:hypothetical protein [Erwinia tracheiphila]AXF78209.1 DUF1471 domain-containing protein [Erwinia tracheiphila]UIA83070.1 hypothetical protein LU604_22280 [Erwinia tracheiphila]UIA91648.1 hypothetical protein LU632_21740 [Erwinia tracheiphila]